MADLIDRQAAIDVLEERIKANGYSNVALVSELNRSLGYLMSLPPAQPERKKGAWIEEDDAIIHGHCSNCGWASVWQETDVFGMNYCPNCGAQMEV